MLGKIEGAIKGLFAGDGIVDELLTDKGVRIIIDRIPEDLIEWLAKIEQSEFLINLIAVAISKMLPDKHLERAKDVLRTAVASLDERVDDYRRHNGIDKTGGKNNPTGESKPTATTTKGATGPTPAEMMCIYRRLLLNPRLKALKTTRLKALEALYNRPSKKGDKYFGIDQEVYSARVDIALFSIDKNDFINLLDDTLPNRNSFINSAVGTIKAKKTIAKTIVDSVDGALNDLGISPAINDRIVVLEARKATPATTPATPPKKGFWNFIWN